jgi:HAD superfamily hydrolase (TIGR01458 family)
VKVNGEERSPGNVLLRELAEGSWENMDDASRTSFFRQIPMTAKPDAFLIDMDGVISIGGVLVPGARETIHWLRDRGYPFRIVSNTTRRPRSVIAADLSSRGIPVPESCIFTPAMAAISLMGREKRTRAFLLTTRELEEEFMSGGITPAEEGADFVVAGDAGDRFTYDRMNTAFRHLLSGAGFLALEKDRYWMGAGGLMLSAGPFVTGLEYASGNTATVLGKPSPSFFAMALSSMGAQPGSTAMIGDDVVTDAGGAISCGLSGILVKTGKYRDEALAAATVKPTAVIPSIADLPGYLEGR